MKTTIEIRAAVGGEDAKLFALNELGPGYIKMVERNN